MDLQTYNVPAAWLHQVRYRALLQALLRARLRVTEPSSSMPELQFQIQSQIRSQVTQLQCRYHTSWSSTRLVFGGTTIFEDGDDSAWFATTLTANNYATGSAETKNCETHLPIEKASSGKCTWRRSNNCTLRTVKRAPSEVMANTLANESRSHMHMLQARMRSWLSLDNPEIHSCYWKSTSKSSVTNLGGTRRSRNG